MTRHEKEVSVLNTILAAIALRTGGRFEVSEKELEKLPEKFVVDISSQDKVIVVRLGS